MPRRKKTDPAPSAANNAAANQEVEPDDVSNWEEEFDKLNGAFLGTLLINVSLLNESWLDAQNREIKQEQVADLKNHFASGIRRYSPETRMRASVTGKTWTTLMTHFLDLFKSEAAGFVPLNSDSKATLEGWTVDSLKHFAKKASGLFPKPDPAQSSHLMVLNWIDDDDFPRPVLEAGQHRKHALIGFNREKFMCRDLERINPLVGGQI
jgi:hypothetical protein